MLRTHYFMSTVAIKKKCLSPPKTYKGKISYLGNEKKQNLEQQLREPLVILPILLLILLL